MVNLRDFHKAGVRLPQAIRNWVRMRTIALEGRVEYLDADISQEALMAVAVVHLMEKGDDEVAQIVARLAPRLEAMFRSEAPEAQGETPAERVDGGDHGIGHGAKVGGKLPIKKKASPKKRDRA